MFSSNYAARQAGWFSRRYKDSFGLTSYRIEQDDKQKDKMDDVKLRADARAERSDKEQIAHLDSILGVGVGAKKERARLQARIEAAI